LHAPTLKQTRFKITASQPFSAVVQFLRKKLRLKENEGVWCYVGNFAPGGDEGVGGLWKVSCSPLICKIK
jgi:ubiquitin-like protein ATG12